MPDPIFADPTFESAPTHEQRRLHLTAMDSVRPVDARAMDIGPDRDDPIGRVRYEAFLALMEGREFVAVRDVIAWSNDAYPDVA